MFVAACTGQGSTGESRQVASTTTDVVAQAGAALHRAVRLPTAARGGRCPVTRVVSQPTPGVSPMLGTGPALPVGIVDGVLRYVAPSRPGDSQYALNAFAGSKWGGDVFLARQGQPGRYCADTPATDTEAADMSRCSRQSAPRIGLFIGHGIVPRDPRERPTTGMNPAVLRSFH
jgi:hypothetical protein